LDRIDLYSEVDSVKHEDLLKDGNEESSEQIRLRVEKAKKRQLERYKRPSKTNAGMTNQDIKRYAKLSASAQELLNKAAERLAISPRSYMRIIKVARTIADLGGAEGIEPEHISEALQYRRPTISV